MDVLLEGMIVLLWPGKRAVCMSRPGGTAFRLSGGRGTLFHAHAKKHRGEPGRRRVGRKTGREKEKRIKQGKEGTERTERAEQAEKPGEIKKGKGEKEIKYSRKTV